MGEEARKRGAAGIPNWDVGGKVYRERPSWRKMPVQQGLEQKDRQAWQCANWDAIFAESGCRTDVSESEDVLGLGHGAVEGKTFFAQAIA